MTRERLRRVVRTATAARPDGPRFYPQRPSPRLWAAYPCGLAATQTHAAGVRWTPLPAASVAPSRAQNLLLRIDAPAWWTLGLTWAFAR